MLGFNVPKKYKNSIFNNIEEHEVPKLTEVILGMNFTDNIYKNTKELKEEIWSLYTNHLLNDLNLSKCCGDDSYIRDYILKDYILSHEEQIEIMESLTKDRHYKLNGLVIENILKLVNVLKKPYTELLSIENKDSSQERKDLILKNIYNTLDMFFNVINDLNEEADNENYDLISSKENSEMFSELNDYKDVLSKMKENLLSKKEVN